VQRAESRSRNQPPSIRCRNTRRARTYCLGERRFSDPPCLTRYLASLKSSWFGSILASHQFICWSSRRGNFNNLENRQNVDVRVVDATAFSYRRMRYPMYKFILHFLVICRNVDRTKPDRRSGNLRCARIG
jgi:hypothetical protein